MMIYGVNYQTISPGRKARQKPPPRYSTQILYPIQTLHLLMEVYISLTFKKVSLKLLASFSILLDDEVCFHRHYMYGQGRGRLALQKDYRIVVLWNLDLLLYDPRSRLLPSPDHTATGCCNHSEHRLHHTCTCRARTRRTRLGWWRLCLPRWGWNPNSRSGCWSSLAAVGTHRPLPGWRALWTWRSTRSWTATATHTASILKWCLTASCAFLIIHKQKKGKPNLKRI